MASSVETPEREDSSGSEIDADMASNSGPRPGKDQLAKRLWIGLVVSIILNAIIWINLSSILKNHVVRELPPVTFRRIILPPPPTPKPMPTPPPTKPLPTPPPPIQQKVMPTQKQSSPQLDQHSPVMTTNAPGPSTGSALAGGTALVGKPIQSQQPTVIATPEPTPVPQPTQMPTPVSTPKATPTPIPPPPGPTQDAQATSQPYPDIPDDLKNDEYKSYVRVRVSIGADGTTTDVTLVSSSGNEDIDQRVIDALKHWKWKPALKNGNPVESSQKFRFDFEVN